jgi:hypothetical protein
MPAAAAEAGSSFLHAQNIKRHAEVKIRILVRKLAPDVPNVTEQGSQKG